MRLLEVLLADPRVDVNWKNVDGDFALHYALELGNVKAVQLLCACPRTDVNAQDHWLVCFLFTIHHFIRLRSWDLQMPWQLSLLRRMWICLLLMRMG